MSEGTLEALTREAMRYAEGQVTFAWQGGEPTLAGLDFFRRAVELQRIYARPGLAVENTIQTNGMLVDDEWAAFFKENGFLVGLSLDGGRRVNDAARVDRRGVGTFGRVMGAVDTLRRHGVDFNVLTVVTARSAERPADVYRFLTKQGFGWLQFIPCMDDSALGGSPWAVEPRAYGEFLAGVFDLWYEDFCRGSAPDVRMFSNLAQMAAGFAPEECGMCGRCTTYFAVESDGSVYPCDFYTTDAWLLGNVNDVSFGDGFVFTHSPDDAARDAGRSTRQCVKTNPSPHDTSDTSGFQRLFDSPRSRAFMAASVQKPPKCLLCPWYRLCRGGCRRWRDFARVPGTGAAAVAGDGGFRGEEAPAGLGLNYLCEGYEVFFEHCADRIARLGQVVRRNVALGLV